MFRLKLANHAAVAATVTVVVGGVLAAAGPPSAAAAKAVSCHSWSGVQPPNHGSLANSLNDVSVLSSCSAWAVGDYLIGPTTTRSLILHWNGSAWKLVPSPDVGGSTASDGLTSVAAVSAKNAWAVGSYAVPGSNFQTLTLHWNGHAWKHVPSPSPGGPSHPNELNAVAADSAGHAWAVGFYFDGTNDKPLILHWNGHAWKQVHCPNPAGSPTTLLHGVSLVPGGHAWAVGAFYDGQADQTLIVSWNGHAWKRISSPSAGGSAHNNILNAITARSAKDAWTVGLSAGNTGPLQTLIEHWNGHSWKLVKSKNPAGASRDNFLSDVAVTAAGNAWAVGSDNNGTAAQTLIEHWNGHSWNTVRSANPGGSSADNVLTAISANSSADAWAVGSYGMVRRTLGLRFS